MEKNGQYIELKSKLDLIFQADEKANKIEEKINMQMEEIEKTKAVIDRFQECLAEQNKMLQRVNLLIVMNPFKRDIIAI